MMNPDNNFSTPQRQSLLGVVVYFLKNGRAFFSILVVLFATSGKFEYGTLFLIGGITLLILIIGLISYQQYLNFTFHIEKDELIVHKGIFIKEKRIIPFDRIQSVHIHQNIIQQLIGVVGLKIDSAGSQKKELEISALDAHTARQFQTILQGRPSAISDEVDLTDASSPVLVQLSIGDLLKVGITENHLKSGLLAVAVVYGYLSQYSKYLEDYLEGYISTDLEDYLPELIRMGMFYALIAILVFTVISVLLSLGRTVLRFFEFRARLDGEMIAISAGLLKKYQHRIPLQKIQYLIWETNPLRKILGFESIHVKQAQSAQEQQKQAVEIPACYQEQTNRLEEAVFNRKVLPGPNIIRPGITPYLLISGYVSFLLAGGIFGWRFFHGEIRTEVLLLIPLIMFLSYQYGKSVSVDFQDDLIIVKKGWIFKKRIILPLYKAQSVGFRQSIFLKRRKLAHFIFYSASGSVRISYLPESAVRDLYNFTLYRTESHKGSWM